MIRSRVLFSSALLLMLAGTAAAQTRERLNLFAADVRVALPGYKTASSIASEIGVAADDLPGRGLGLVFGAHIYPLRKGVVTLGLGAELMMSGRSHTPEPTTAGAPTPLTVRTRFSALSPQLSLNFGSKQGWSYISGGVGWGNFTTELEETPLPAAEARPKVLNYGGGARWFLNDHMALSLDLRFYVVSPQEAGLGRPAFSRVNSTAFNVGIGLK